MASRTCRARYTRGQRFSSHSESRPLASSSRTARRAVRELEAKGLLSEWDEKRWPRVYLARHVLDAILHPLEDLRSMSGTAAQGAVLKSGAGEQQAPLRSADRLMAEAMAILDAAKEHGAQLRLTGGLAIRRYCIDLDFMDREYSDIDFVGLSSCLLYTSPSPRD